MIHNEFDKYLVELLDEKTSEQKIDKLFQKLSISASDEYIKFLQKYQGANFQPCQYIKDEGDFYSFYSIDEIEFNYKFLRSNVETEQEIYCYNGHLLPIAATCFYSAYICLPISTMFDKGVWLMDYNIDESDLPKEEWKAVTRQLSNSISEFLSICSRNLL